MFSLITGECVCFYCSSDREFIGDSITKRITKILEVRFTGKGPRSERVAALRQIVKKIERSGLT